MNATIRNALLALIVVCCMLIDRSEAGDIQVKGPFSIEMADYDYDYAFLTRDKDNCSAFTTTDPISFKFGNILYNQIVVCGNGYIIPGTVGVRETATPMVNGNDFDTPTSPAIAIGLIENDRNDELFDLNCWYQPFGIVNPQRYCAAMKQALLSIQGGSTQADLEAIDFDIQPAYDPGATNAGIVEAWINGGNNVVNYYSLRRPKDLDLDLKVSLFSTAADSPRAFWEPDVLNNVLIRTVSASDSAMIAALSGDSRLIPDWMVCISWYKVTQPPEIVDKHNSFQLSIACMARLTNASLPSKCVATFDYFEIEYYEQDGQIMRAGATGPGLTPFELPGSGDAATVLNLVTDSNVNISGIWFYEINQCSYSASLLKNYSFSDPLPGLLCPVRELNITLASVNSTSAYFNVADYSAGSTVSNMAASCDSDLDNGCGHFEFESNSQELLNAWLQVNGLMSGTAYRISIDNSTFAGIPDTVHVSSKINFCTDLALKPEHFEIDALNSTSINISLASNASNFDNGTVSVYNASSGALLTQESFQRSQFPIKVHNLPMIEADALNVFNLTFSFSVGTGGTDCGVTGVQISEEFSLLYPNSTDEVSDSDGNCAEATGPMSGLFLLAIAVLNIT